MTTYIVDLNDVLEGSLLVISPRHTVENGHTDLSPEFFPPIGEGEHVTLYSGDESMTWDATVVKELGNDRYAVRPDWATGQTKRLAMSDRVSLHGVDPVDAVRAMLRTPPSAD